MDAETVPLVHPVADDVLVGEVDAQKLVVGEKVCDPHDVDVGEDDWETERLSLKDPETVSDSVGLDVTLALDVDDVESDSVPLEQPE